MALKICEAELLAMNSTVKHALYIRGLVAEVRFRQDKPTPLYFDNRSTCLIAQTGNYGKRTRHIAVRLSLLREEAGNETTVIFTPGDKQKADVFTKALSRILLRRAIDLIKGDML